MKHHVCAVLFFVSPMIYAEADKHAVADKSTRIGRFNYEDSFDENLVEEILKNSPVIVKKNIKNLLYPANEDDVPQRLLLLGGTSNASTTAIAKAIALRCGYDYYLIEASALLKEYREGRQMLLNEVRPIIKKGKPIALIITELPEMADYSGLLASTLWMLIDQCAQYPDVLVIGTSACNKGQLSEDIQERFGKNIISVVLDQLMQEQIEELASNMSWLERNKMTCIITAGVLLTVHVVVQMLCAITQTIILQEQYDLQKQQRATQLQQYLTQLYQFVIENQVYSFTSGRYTKNNQYDKYLNQLSEVDRKVIIESDAANLQAAENTKIILEKFQCDNPKWY